MDRPKIGLALSGASGRAIAHAGVLDALEENGIKVDYIAACSSATIIAAAHSCGTLKELEQLLFTSFNHKELLSVVGLPKNGSGLLSLSKAEERLRHYTKNANMENVKPQLAFVAVDLDTGEQVAISMGDMVKGIIASCSVPGLFEPVKWGHKTLVDGGLINLVPADVVRAMGADIVISVDIAAAKYIFNDEDIRILKSLLWLVRGTIYPYTFLKKTGKFIAEIFKKGNFVKFYSQSDFIVPEQYPSLLQVVGKVIEITSKRRQWAMPHEAISDIVIEPKVKHLGKTNFASSKMAYQEGKKATIRLMPQIRAAILAAQKGNLDRQLQPQLPLTPNLASDLTNNPITKLSES